MTKNPIIEALRSQGIWEGRTITFSKTRYVKWHRRNFAVFNAQVFTKKSRVLRQADLDLSLDADKLTAAARQANENLYVLHENTPHPFWQPGSTPVSQVLLDAVWWTRIHPQDDDVFLSPDPAVRRAKRVRLTCRTGFWQGRPAYALDVWTNEKWYGTNTSGAVVELSGKPPSDFRCAEKAKRREELTALPSKTRGRPVRPAFYQRSGPLEIVWFNHGAPVPAILFDNSVGLLRDVTFTCHQDVKAIHVRRGEQVIGLVWPCTIWAPEVVAAAKTRLRLHAKKPRGKGP